MSPFVECRRGFKPLQPVVMETYLSEKYKDFKRFRATGPCGFYGRLIRRHSFSFFSEWLDSTYDVADHGKVNDQHAVVDSHFGIPGFQQSKRFSTTSPEQDAVDEMTMVLDRLPKDRSMFRSTCSTTCSEQHRATFDQDCDPDYVSSRIVPVSDGTPWNHSMLFGTSSSSSLGQYQSPFDQDGSPNDEHLESCDDESTDEFGHTSGIACQDSFLMMQNIPHHIKLDTLIDSLHNSGFEGCYTALYMPIDLKRRQCQGYAFIGMSSHRMAEELRLRWHKTKLFGSGMRKPVSVKFAPTQGLAENADRWARKNTGRIRNPACRPRFFTPTRF